MHDDNAEEFNPYRPPKAVLVMPKARRGAWRKRPVRVSPLQGWSWVLPETWRLVGARPVFWIAMGLLLGGLGQFWDFFLTDRLSNNLLKALLTIGPLLTAIAFFPAWRQLTDDNRHTGTGKFSSALLGALPFCPLSGFLSRGYFYCFWSLYWLYAAPQLPKDFIPLPVLFLMGSLLGTGRYVLHLFVMTATGLVVLARRNPVASLYHAAFTLLRNWAAVGLAGLTITGVAWGCRELTDTVMSFAEYCGVQEAWLKPLCKTLTFLPVKLVCILVPCLMLRDMFFDFGDSKERE